MLKNIPQIWCMMILGALSTGCSVFGIRGEETPVYEVVRVSGNKEIRKYDELIVAKTTVSGDYEEAQNKAFRILADYIFGNNREDASIAMTAPVTQSKAKEGEEIPMTAPVVQEKSELGWTMSFVMPSKYSMSTLPKPIDDRVVIERVPQRYVASIQYSCGRGAERNAAMAAELEAWLREETNFQPISEPMSAGYDPPWTLPFLRRNEMHIEVERQP